MPAGVFERGNRAIGLSPKNYPLVADRARQRLAPSNLMTPSRDIPGIEGKSSILFHGSTSDKTLLDRYFAKQVPSSQSRSSNSRSFASSHFLMLL
jgi:hypothetical protein